MNFDILSLQNSKGNGNGVRGSGQPPFLNRPKNTNPSVRDLCDLGFILELFDLFDDLLDTDLRVIELPVTRLVVVAHKDIFDP